MDCPYWIKFDVGKIAELKVSHEAAMQTTLDMLPEGVNWTKEKEVIKYFNEVLQIELHSIKISEIEGHLELQDETTEAWEVIYGLTAYLKLKYTVTNYCNCILKHQIYGIVHLRYVDKKIVMPNRQPIFYSTEIWECVTHCSKEVPNSELFYNTI